MGGDTCSIELTVRTGGAITGGRNRGGEAERILARDCGC